MSRSKSRNVTTITMFEAQTGQWPCDQAAGIEWEDERRNESPFAWVKRILIDLILLLLLLLLLKVLDIHKSIQQVGLILWYSQMDWKESSRIVCFWMKKQMNGCCTTDAQSQQIRWIIYIWIESAMPCDKIISECIFALVKCELSLL